MSADDMSKKLGDLGKFNAYMELTAKAGKFKHPRIVWISAHLSLLAAVFLDRPQALYEWTLLFFSLVALNWFYWIVAPLQEQWSARYNPIYCPKIISRNPGIWFVFFRPIPLVALNSCAILYAYWRDWTTAALLSSLIPLRYLLHGAFEYMACRKMGILYLRGVQLLAEPARQEEGLLKIAEAFPLSNDPERQFNYSKGISRSDLSGELHDVFTQNNSGHRMFIKWLGNTPVGLEFNDNFIDDIITSGRAKAIISG